MRGLLQVVVTLGACVACADPPERTRVATDSARADSVARERQDSLNRLQPGYVVDSILPVEEELRRFRAAVGPATDGLVGASTRRDALVCRSAPAPERGDTGHVHVKIETGTQRQGVLERDIPAFVERIRGARGLTLAGVTSHFANIEDTTNHEFAESQMAAFSRIADAIAQGIAYEQDRLTPENLDEFLTK